MIRGIFIGGLVLAVALPVGYYIKEQGDPLPYGRTDVVAISLEPYPEGPSSPKFVRHPRSEHEVSLSLIEAVIPSRLPRDVWQGFGCDLGGNVVVQIANGEQIEYGPCRRPAPIERLRRIILEELRQSPPPNLGSA